MKFKRCLTEVLTKLSRIDVTVESGQNWKPQTKRPTRSRFPHQEVHHSFNKDVKIGRFYSLTQPSKDSSRSVRGNLSNHRMVGSKE